MRKLTDQEIVVASHNAGKVREINALIGPFGFSAKSAADLGLPEPEETGTTFEENAAIKALSATRITGLPAMADDSGICIDALDGEPGVYTADWAEKEDGSGRDFNLAMSKVNAKLQTKPDLPRTAHFVAVLCLAWPDEHLEYFRGEVEGQIIWPPRGERGFGYDPIFMPEGYDITFGEMSAEEKHGWLPGQSDDGLSHRSRAFAKFARECLSR
ncbi:MAG: RdgB/HAM1 family non-canonical purine NTP pyrophosphatase [Pseudomonadota bacterium]